MSESASYNRTECEHDWRDNASVRSCARCGLTHNLYGIVASFPMASNPFDSVDVTVNAVLYGRIVSLGEDVWYRLDRLEYGQYGAVTIERYNENPYQRAKNRRYKRATIAVDCDSSAQPLPTL